MWEIGIVGVLYDKVINNEGEYGVTGAVPVEVMGVGVLVAHALRE